MNKQTKLSKIYAETLLVNNGLSSACLVGAPFLSTPISQKSLCRRVETKID